MRAASLSDARSLGPLLRRIVLGTTAVGVSVVAFGCGDASNASQGDASTCADCHCGGGAPAPGPKFVPFDPSTQCTADGGTPVVADGGDAAPSSDAAVVDAAGLDAGDAACSPAPPDCQRLCPTDVGGAFVGMCKVVSDGGQTLLECDYYPHPCGRRPSGLAASRMRSDAHATRRILADAAFLEAASVDAFDILARELAAHRAPARLVRAARSARADEVRHARDVGRHARKHGARVAVPCVARSASRSIEAIAIENAAEGCVREMYGALLAAWQAATARDEEFRATMETVAKDEARHAALAWRVSAWAEGRLGASARRRVERARRDALRTLRDDIAVEPERGARATLGLPDARTAAMLVEALAHSFA